MISMHFVKALESGLWDGRDGRRFVRVLVDHAIWLGRNVEQGMLFGFNKPDDADYFLTVHQSERLGVPRCEPFTVVAGQVVPVEDPADASWLVQTGKAISLTIEQVHAEFAAARQELAQIASGDAEEGETVERETKAVTPVVETSPPTPIAAPTPAPKPARSGKRR